MSVGEEREGISSFAGSIFRVAWTIHIERGAGLLI